MKRRGNRSVCVSRGQIDLVHDCQALARALRVPSNQSNILERAIRAVLTGLTREARRAGLDVRAIILADRAARALKQRKPKAQHPTACPPPSGPRVRID